MSYPTPMDVAEADDFAADDYCEDGCMLMGSHNVCDTAKSADAAANALDAALDWPYSREAWDQIDAERLELLAVNDALALEVERMTAHAKMFADQLAALQNAAWDVCDVVQDALDTPEDADMKRIQAALDAMGELIPAARPPVRAAVAPIQWFCGPCNCWHSPPMHTEQESVTP